jgi:tripartite-type tricarboxylate transporter receptor subunit TctC
MNFRMSTALAIVLITAIHPAAAQSWPTKPIRAFIPFSAGSATDIVPRAVFEPLSAELGQPIVVENRGGAGGTVGIGAVVAAEPDGYTILANSSEHTVAPFIVPNLPYNVGTDLRAVVALGTSAGVLVVSRTSPGTRSMTSSQLRGTSREHSTSAPPVSAPGPI